MCGITDMLMRGFISSVEVFIYRNNSECLFLLFDL